MNQKSIKEYSRVLCTTCLVRLSHHSGERELIVFTTYCFSLR